MNKEQMIEELRKLMKVCPKRVCNGSYQTVIDFKKAMAAAIRAVGNSRSTETSLRAAIAGLRAFEDR